MMVALAHPTYHALSANPKCSSVAAWRCRFNAGPTPLTLTQCWAIPSKTRYVDPMFGICWPAVCPIGPSSPQHFVTALGFLVCPWTHGHTAFLRRWITAVWWETNSSTRRCCDVESTSLTLIQHHNNVVCPVGRHQLIASVYAEHFRVKSKHPSWIATHAHSARVTIAAITSCTSRVYNYSTLYC